MRWLVVLLIAGIATGAGTIAEARQRDPSGVRAFIEHIYADYPRRTPWPDKEYEALFAPELGALIHRNDTYSTDEVGPLDGDPFCQCQDDAGFHYQIVSIAAAGGKAKALVRTMFGPPVSEPGEQLTYSLVRIGGRWRIDDIGTRGQPSLKAWLRHELDKPH